MLSRLLERPRGPSLVEGNSRGEFILKCFRVCCLEGGVFFFGYRFPQHGRGFFRWSIKAPTSFLFEEPKENPFSLFFEAHVQNQ